MRDPKDILTTLRDSLDADVLREDYPQELVDAELREAGCDPADLVARNRPKIDALLARRKACAVSQSYEGPNDIDERLVAIIASAPTVGVDNAIRLAFALGRESAGANHS